MGAHPSVFVSFARADRELADQVAKSLGHAGLNVKRADTDLQAGELKSIIPKSCRLFG